MRKNTIFTLIAVLLFAVCSVQTTLAAFKVADESVNEIDLASVRAQIVEQYEPAGSVYPGGAVDKMVNVENTGSIDCVVRVKIEKAWGETRDEDGKLIVNSDYSTENILIEYNTEYWLMTKSTDIFTTRAY